MVTKIGRNDSCHCGSGRKYKLCCMARPSGGRADEADRLHRQAFELHAVGRLIEAADRYRAALQVDPRFFEAWVNFGNLLQDQGLYEQALDRFRRALSLRPERGDLNMNIGLALRAMKRLDEAIESFRLAAGRGDARALHNLGVALYEAGRAEQAEASFLAALRVEPRNAEILRGLGDALRALGRHGESIERYREALSIAPQMAVLHECLGAAYLTQGDPGTAAEQFRRALRLDPGLNSAHSSLLMAMLYLDTEPAERIHMEHRRYAERFEAPLAPPAPQYPGVRDPHRRLRLGYVSGDFRAHSVASFIEPVLAHHDKRAFEVYCYYNNAAPDDVVTGRLRGWADHWIACAQLTDEELAQRIRVDEIDILVDLSGHTAGGRLLVFARRPAPLQLSWIGYSGATGLRHIQWHLSDHRASPPLADRALPASEDADQYFRLPEVFSCYRPPADAPAVAETPALKSGQVTLGSFNNITKISDRVVRVWSRLLVAQPSLRLALKHKAYEDEAVRARLVGRFADQGVEASRLLLLGRASTTVEHLELYSRIDIALDTFPYCGVTTTCEALWMGVPVVSLAGQIMVERMGLALLAAIGRSEWVAASEDDYLRIVVALTSDHGRLAAIRSTLRAQLRDSPLCQEARFTGHLERAYRSLWHRWCGHPAVDLSASESVA